MNPNGELLTCGRCRHWHMTPLSNGIHGECREGPPQIALPIVNKLTGQLQGMQVAYPGLPAQFPACGRFQERLELSVT